MELNWLYRRLGEDFGPVTLETLHELLTTGQVDPDDLVRRVDETEWQPATSLPALEIDSDSQFDLDIGSMLSAATRASAREAAVDHTACERRNFAPVRSAKNKRSAPAPVAIPEPAAVPANWYCSSLGQVLGPYTFDALKEMAVDGTLSPTDDVREGVDGTWLSAKRLPELFPKTASTGKSSAEMDAVNLDRVEWFCRIDGDEFGPMSLNDLQKRIGEGTLDRKDLVRRSWGAAWLHAQDIPGLAFPVAAAVAAPVVAPVAAKSSALEETKSFAPIRKDSNREIDAVPAERPTPRPAIAESTLSSYAETARAASPVASSYGASSTTPPPSYRPTPVAPPPPPPRASRSSSGPSWSFSLPSGLLDNLKNPKLLAGAGGFVVVLALVFGAKFFIGAPGVKEFATIQQLWDEVDKAIQSNAADGTFQEMKSKHTAEVKALKAAIEKKASAQNRLAQIILYCTRDHLPKIYEGSAPERTKRHAMMKADMQEASELFQRHTS